MSARDHERCRTGRQPSPFRHEVEQVRAGERVVADMHRRLLCALSAAAILLLCSTPALGAAGEPVTVDRDCLRYVRGIDLQTVTIPRLQAAMNARKITSVQLVEAYEARIKAYDKYDAIRALNPRALEIAAARDRQR